MNTVPLLATTKPDVARDGKLLATWPKKRQLRHLVECLDSRRVPLNSAQRADAPGGIPYWGAGGVVGTVGRALFDEELVLLGEDGAPFYDKSRPVAFRVEGPVWINNHIHVLRPRAEISSRYLVYALNSVDYSHYISGSTRDKLTQDDMWSIRIPAPQLDEQRQIADYLDAHTAKIDVLIEKQERLIETLAERRHAVITEIMEGQANPARAPENSRLGLRIKSLYDVIDSRAGEQDLPLLSVSIHRGVQRRDETTDDDPRSDNLSVYKTCEAGDIIVNRMRAFQGAVGLAVERGLTSPDYLVVRPRDSVDARWLTTLMRSRWFVGEMTSRLRGIGSTSIGTVRTPRINAKDLGEIRVRLPSLIDQHATSAHLERETARMDALSAKAREMIDVLKERRQALISAVVTGKIDVRGLS